MTKKSKSSNKSSASTATITTTSSGSVAPATQASAAPALKDAVKSASSSYVDQGALAQKSNGHTATATASTTPVQSAPVAKPATTTTTTATTASTSQAPRAANAPVQVSFNGKKAVIRYSGQLAHRGGDKVVARVGLEWFGSPRWQSQQEVELRRAGDGVFEGELAVNGKDATGKDLMAVQLAFLSPTTKDWDSAGAPYGYYQVSALTGHVEPVRQ